jgi:cadmium resistance protein CadD (predicted permease)
MRIADLRRRGDVRTGETRHRSQSRNGCAGRIAAVAVVATSGAIDNVLVYASVLAGRASLEFLLVASAFGVLTALLCAGALLTARSRVSATTVQRATGCVAPFFTTAIGVALLIRFDTLPWIYSFA